jgi:hypothetical protein
MLIGSKTAPSNTAHSKAQQYVLSSVCECVYVCEGDRESVHECVCARKHAVYTS